MSSSAFSSSLPQLALVLWRIRLLLGCLPIAFGGGFLYFTLPHIFTIYSFFWLAIFLLTCFLYLPFRYSQFSYAVTKTMIKVNRGVFYYRMDAIYIKNIQYTALTQAPLQKLLNLATLHVFAAGGALHLPSLTYADARLLRIQLLKKMEAGPYVPSQSPREKA